MDVSFDAPGVPPTPVESKFLEPSSHHAPLKTKDIETPHTWDALPRSAVLAKTLCHGQSPFTFLDAPQLLKHILGLTTEFKPGRFRLLYLWYDVGEPFAQAHRDDIALFKKSIAPTS